MTRPSLLTGLVNAEFQVRDIPRTGATWPGDRDATPRVFRGVLERVEDLDMTRRVGAGQAVDPTHSVLCNAEAGQPPVVPGEGLDLVRVRVSGSWRLVDPPTRFVVGPVNQHPGNDTVRFTVVEASWSPSGSR